MNSNIDYDHAAGGVNILSAKQWIRVVAIVVALGDGRAVAAFTVIHDFQGSPVFPTFGLVSDDSGTLYGVTEETGWAGVSGTGGGGTIYSLGTDGGHFKILHNFLEGEGLQPAGSLILDGAAGHLFGMTGAAIYSMRTDGTEFSVLHTFGAYGDGVDPRGSLVADTSGYLYGVTNSGGANGGGTIFKIRTDGTEYVILRSFSGGANDGLNPQDALMFDQSSSLFGTTSLGGTANLGTVFRIETDGTGFRILHSFAGTPNDGTSPGASLVTDAQGGLYGTTIFGGVNDLGTVYSVRTDGTGFVLLHSFAGGTSDGASPASSLIIDSSRNLYGTTTYTYEFGGGFGAVFEITTGGSGFSILHSFDAADGQNPASAVAFDNLGRLVGTTTFGGAQNLPSRSGVVYVLKTDGTGSSVLHTFESYAADGGSPAGALTLGSAGMFYGITSAGGSSNTGTLFRIQSDGSGFKTVCSLNDDAFDPVGGLVADAEGYLYGTSTHGGGNAISSGLGMIFKIKTDGSHYSVIHNFGESRFTPEGETPVAPLILDESGILYGTTVDGSSGPGTVFKIQTDGGNFVILRTFTDAQGRNPRGSLVLDGAGNLYGTASEGGPGGLGTVFTMRVDGSGFSILHSFGGPDGQEPYGGLVIDKAGYLYGTTNAGGSFGGGTVFKLRVDGSEFVVLHDFGGRGVDGGSVDGTYPRAQLLLDDFGYLYGTTSGGNDNGRYSGGPGTVFQLKTTGKEFVTLHQYTGMADDGNPPSGSLVFDGFGNLYGAAAGGGLGGAGILFKIGPLIHLTPVAVRPVAPIGGRHP